MKITRIVIRKKSFLIFFENGIFIDIKNIDKSFAFLRKKIISKKVRKDDAFKILEYLLYKKCVGSEKIIKFFGKIIKNVRYFAETINFSQSSARQGMKKAKRRSFKNQFFI